MVAFHLLRYMVKIWEKSLKKRRKTRLSPIIPLVVYHGADSWKVGLTFHDLLEPGAEFQAYVPDFSYLLYDLSNFSDDRIRGTIYSQIMLLLLKYIFRPELRERLPDILNLLAELSTKSTGKDYIITVLRYIAAGTDQLDPDELNQVVHDAFSHQAGGSAMPTPAEIWYKEGRVEGRVEGREEGREEVLHITREAIMDILGLRFKNVPKPVQQCLILIKDPDLLDKLRQNAVITASMSAFEVFLKTVAPDIVKKASRSHTE